MKVCADTWFLLKLFAKDKKALSVISGLKTCKYEMVIPLIVICEAYKKLFQVGISRKVIDSFVSLLEASPKVRIIPMDRVIAIEASWLSVSFGLPLIDSIIAATAIITGYKNVITRDKHFEILEKKKKINIVKL